MLSTQSGDVSDVFSPSEPTVCPSGCGKPGSRLARVVLYTPVLLIAAGVAALAIHPELAEYASPLLGEQKHACPNARVGVPSSCCADDSSAACPLCNAPGNAAAAEMIADESIFFADDLPMKAATSLESGELTTEREPSAD